ncbi:MAG TPA: hypothetical protein VGK25_07670 [Ignavibacteria bacterium]|jgi:hypothetical protein
MFIAEIYRRWAGSKGVSLPDAIEIKKISIIRLSVCLLQAGGSFEPALGILSYFYKY